MEEDESALITQYQAQGVSVALRILERILFSVEDLYTGQEETREGIIVSLANPLSLGERARLADLVQQARAAIETLAGRFDLYHETADLAREVAYGQLGTLTDRDLASQLNRATCLSLLLNVIAVWNTRYMQAALEHLEARGYVVLASDLEHLSPVISAHILLHGTHHFDLQAPKKRQGQLRSLRVAGLAGPQF